jgi:hypothetical protein
MNTKIQFLTAVLVILVGASNVVAQNTVPNLDGAITSTDVGSATPAPLAANAPPGGTGELPNIIDDSSILGLVWGNFAISSSPPVGPMPVSLVAADVNGDGKPDLISANAVDNTLTVLTNNGNGEFVTSVILRVGTYPFAVLAADVNGDGKPDLICANIFYSTLTILTNDGSGGFFVSTTLNPGWLSYVSPVIADVNGDGKPDLVCATLDHDQMNTLTILTNDGSGGFVVSATLNLGTIDTTFSLSSVIAADVNGDGKPDLIYANIGDNSLTVLTNDGNGGFVHSATLATESPWSVTAADVNGDGKPDLICASFYTNTLTVLTNDGSGGFATSATLDVDMHRGAVIAADMNGDGWPDLICGGSKLTVLTNNGAGGFVTSATPASCAFFSVVAADVNGDGHPDLIFINGLLADALTVLTNYPVRTVAITASVTPVTIESPIIPTTPVNLTVTLPPVNLSP